MIRTLFTTLLLLFWGWTSIQACDGCGCSMSSVYWGLLPNNSNHYVGLWWQHQRYRTGLGNLDANPNNEWFNTVELRTRFLVHPKVQVIAILPYAYHLRQQDGTSTILSGVGDGIVMGSYTVLNTRDSLQSTIRHQLTLGGGLKLPTGRFEQMEADQTINPGFQLGTGSLDWLLNLGYTARINRFGLNADLTYKKNTANENDYRFGDRVSGALSLFYMAAHRRWELMPNAGIFGEYARWDVQEGYYRTFTGGHALMGIVGLELYNGPVNFGVNYNVPLQQELNDGAIEARSRVSVHLNYFF